LPDEPSTSIVPPARDVGARLDNARPLAREASDLQRALDALNGVPAAPAARGCRRRRESGQSAAPRRSGSPRGDIRARVVDYVAANPGSTASDVAKALGLNRNSVATRLTQLRKRGDLVKARRGYSAA
jgi:Winged helix-turn-helix DNA-binding